MWNSFPQVHLQHERWLVGHHPAPPPAPVLVIDVDADLETVYRSIDRHRHTILGDRAKADK